MPSHYVLLFVPLAVVALSGCDEPAWPEVSEANCSMEKIIQMKDGDRRRDFDGFCRQIPTSTWPIRPEKWYALDAAEQQKFHDAVAVIRPTQKPLNWLNLNP